MRLSEFWFAGLICRYIGHRWDEFHMYDVVCSRCRTCREWTEEDEKNFRKARRDKWALNIWKV
jgi:Prophage protein (DUF1660)